MRIDAALSLSLFTPLRLLWSCRSIVIRKGRKKKKEERGKKKEERRKKKKETKKKMKKEKRFFLSQMLPIV